MTHRWPLQHHGHTRVGFSPPYVNKGMTHITNDLINAGESGYFMMMFLQHKYE